MAHLFLFLFALAVVTVLPSPSIAFPTTLNLERLRSPGPYNHTLALLRDQARASSLLSASSTTGVPEFQLNGTLQPEGFYYTRIRLGTPPRELTVQIDTGSDVLWVQCISCQGCPTSRTSPSPYDYRASTSGSPVSCIDEGCRLAAESSSAYCSSGDRLCSYRIDYGDLSTTSGYYVRDVLHSDVFGVNSTSHAATPIIFGCSTEAARFVTTDYLIDGILGLGKSSISVVDQLASEGVTPRAFTHCFLGDSYGGGGVLVFGGAVDPSITYTPLVIPGSHYNVNLRSIYVNSQLISLDRSTFASPSYQGTIIDSGTTLVLLADEAYDRVVQSVMTTVSGIASPVLLPNLCYSVSASVSVDVFPHIRLEFDGGAYISLAPQDYLQQSFSFNVSITTWCMQIGRSHDITIIGDVALRDKIVVYDLAAQRIGWADYDCSLPIAVSAGDPVVTGNDHARPPQRSVSVRIISPVLCTMVLLFGVVSLVV